LLAIVSSALDCDVWGLAVLAEVAGLLAWPYMLSRLSPCADEAGRVACTEALLKSLIDTSLGVIAAIGARLHGNLTTNPATCSGVRFPTHSGFGARRRRRTGAVVIPGGFAPEGMRRHKPMIEFVRKVHDQGALRAGNLIAALGSQQEQFCEWAKRPADFVLNGVGRSSFGSASTSRAW